MKRFVPTLVLSAAVLISITSVAAAEDNIHTVMTPDAVTWGAAPPVLPQGAQAAVLHGDPSKPGLFILRIKFPSGYHIPPHTHPIDEVVTVLSGTFKLGMGEAADKNKAQTLPAGSLFALSPNMAHFAYMDEDTIIQINTNGPWGLTYVNPKDDPRQRSQ